jgi:hypothetical protein
MPSDAAYLTKMSPIARLLVESSKGDFSAIPEWYADFLYHEYDDGDVSMMGTLPKFESENGLESWELDEIFDLLSKVDPEKWPFPQDVTSVDADSILAYQFDESVGIPESTDFVEDNLGASEKVQKVIKVVIESVFGSPVNSIRDHKGKFPSVKNNFLQGSDGSFEGTFLHGDLQFAFEVTPTESGWICAYRLNEKSLDKLDGNTSVKDVQSPEMQNKSKVKKAFRRRGW